MGPEAIADSSGVIYVAWPVGPRQTQELSEAGAPRSVVGPPAFRLTPAANGVLAVGPSGTALVTPSGSSVVDSMPAGLNDLGASGGGDVYIYHRDSAAIEKVNQSGTLISSRDFPITKETRQKLNGQVVTLMDSPQVIAMATDGRDSLWFVEVDSDGSYLVNAGL